MDSIGQRLRQARERLGLTVDEAERVTRIRAAHLQALERDDFDSLPSPVQARGFLRNYAEYLGLDSAPFLRELNGNGRKAKNKAAPLTATRPAVRVRRTGWFSSDLVVAATIALGTLALLIWGGGRVMASLRSAAAPADESSPLLIPTATASIAPVATAATEAPAPALGLPSITPTLPPLNLPSGRVSVRLLAVQRAWVRASRDGVELYRGRVEPGAVIDLVGDQVVEVTTGNGAGVRVSYNGQDLGLMGGLDEVVTLLWTLDGERTPTATVTPTPTVTVPPSATPRGTQATPVGG
jgi:cytoskeleton protein RodZ